MKEKAKRLQYTGTHKGSEEESDIHAHDDNQIVFYSNIVYIE